jgi:hypothetical protein
VGEARADERGRNHCRHGVLRPGKASAPTPTPAPPHLLTALVDDRPFARGTWRKANARACTGATTTSSNPSRSRQPPLPLSPRTAKPYALPPLTHLAATRVRVCACVSGRHESHTHDRNPGLERKPQDPQRSHANEGGQQGRGGRLHRVGVERQDHQDLGHPDPAGSHDPRTAPSLFPPPPRSLFRFRSSLALALRRSTRTQT